MSGNDLVNKYFVRKTSTAAWEDITTKFDGVKVLSIDGFNERGEAVNVYNNQWVNSQKEDFLVTTTDGEGNDVIVRENVDLSLTFIVSRRYANSAIDEQTTYDNIVSYLCDNGDFYIKSAYVNKQAHVICTKSFKPTTQKLHRAENSYILATIPLHCLEKPEQTGVIEDAGDIL